MVGFSGHEIKSDAFSTLPFNFVRPEDKPAFGMLSEIILLEMSTRAARRNWAAAQLKNLLDHAWQRSRFWRDRLSAVGPKHRKLSKIPPLTREEVRRQISAEGSLLAARDGVEVKDRMTSGSTGTPVRFYVTDANGIYNEIRSFAQMVLEGRDLRPNRCRLTFDPRKIGLDFKQSDNYAGYLSQIFSTGKNAEINYYNVEMDLIVDKLIKYRAGYIVCLPQFVEKLISMKGEEVFSRIGIRNIFTYGQLMPEFIQSRLDKIGIRHSSNYSCEEVGPIGWECVHAKGHYHVCESNVIVEIGDKRETIDGVTCGNVLVTGLHSYATPFIRYEPGDFARLLDRCPCGFDGPVLTDLFGRIASTLKMPDGTRRPLHVSATFLGERIRYSDLRIRQIDGRRVTVEIAAEEASPEERAKAEEFLRSVIGSSFDTEFTFVEEIDWGPARKRNLFLNLHD